MPPRLRRLAGHLLIVLLIASCGPKPSEESVPAPLPAPKAVINIDILALAPRIPLTGYRPTQVSMADDAQFFAALDLDRPGLEKVKKAAAGGDFPAARSALASYLRARNEPRLVVEGTQVAPHVAGADTKTRLGAGTMAEQAMTKDYKIAGISHKFDGDINWELNPTTQPGYKGAWSGQFHTQLNRMHYWRELANAWRTSGNPAYLDEVLAQMRDWQSKIRPPDGEDVARHVKRYKASSGNVREFRLWLPLDVGQRSMNTTRVFETVRSDARVDDAMLVETMKMLGEHARLLTQLDIDGNHLAIATAGLAMVAVMFPEFKESGEWIREAVARVTVEMGRQVYADGAQMELTPWYHYTALRNFASVLEVAQTNGYAIPPALLDGLRRMFDYIVRVTDPLTAVPPLNDSEYLQAKVLANALTFFPDDAVFSWFATAGAKGISPDFLSLTVPYAGQAVMRTGWKEKDFYLLMEYGPFGTGHMHEDKLGLSVTANGRRLIVDPGRNKYEASTMRDYSINSSAHSTVLFDGLFQARRLQEKALAKVSEPVPVYWESGESCDYVAGSYGADEREVFALPTDPPGNVAPEWFRLVLDGKLREDDVQFTKRMVQHRHVLFVKPAYWVVVDTFDPLDAAPHEYRSLFHLGQGTTAVEGSTVTLGKPGEAGMALAFSAPSGQAELSVVSGQEQPFLMGWTFADGEPSPSPTAIFQTRAEGPTAAAYAIVPHAAGGRAASPRIEWLPGEAGFYKVRVDPGNSLTPVTFRVPADGSKAVWEIHHPPGP